MFPSELVYTVYMVLTALFTVTAALLSLMSREDVYAAVSLGFVGLGVAAFMGLLGYGVLSVFHILVYVGATVTFVVFSVLLIGRGAGVEEKLFLPGILAAVTLGIAYFVSMLVLARTELNIPSISLERLAGEIFTKHTLSLIFLSFALASVMIEGILISSSGGEK